MIVVENTTPRAQAEIIPELADRPARDSRAGEMREELGVLVKSPDPRERHLFRDGYNLAFNLQEHWAYWEGANPGHVERYNSNMETWIDDETGKMPGSAYGERFRSTAGHDQIERAVERLRETPESRRQVLSVHQPAVEDYESNDVACTAYLHPFLRDGRLHMVATARSQDMFWGYPYDTANNQWIQEVLAGLLDAELGEYWHLMDSCHYYTEFEDRALDAAENGKPASAGDCVLQEDAFEYNWALLTDGLEAVRDGEVPRDQLDCMTGSFYGDWLAIMAAYEHHRFHGNLHAAYEMTHAVDNDDWRAWMLERLEVPV